MTEEDLEDWIADLWVNLAGRRASEGPFAPLDDLIDRFCFVDYCMRNAGDLANLEDPPGVAAFLYTACHDARIIGLPQTEALFSLTRAELERAYFERFELVSAELREAWLAHE
jgi:hypothetical protein